jgi:hypothetical protein
MFITEVRVMSLMRKKNKTLVLRTHLGPSPVRFWWGQVFDFL